MCIRRAFRVGAVTSVSLGLVCGGHIAAHAKEQLTLEVGAPTASLLSASSSVLDDALVQFEKSIETSYVDASPSPVWSRSNGERLSSAGFLDFYRELGQADEEAGLDPVKASVAIDQIGTEGSGSSDLKIVIADVRIDISYRDRLTGEMSDGSMTDRHRISIALVNGQPQVTADAFVSVDAQTEPEGVDILDVPMPPPVADDSISPVGFAAAKIVSAAEKPDQPNLKVDKFVKYALKWTDPAHEKKINTAGDYESFSNNCANFVSQSLDHGGWKHRHGFRRGGLNPASINNWSPNIPGPAGSSYTWGGAKFLAAYTYNYAKWGTLRSLNDARTGDLLFTDWDPNNRPDGRIDHVMLVSGMAGNVPRVSQKSPNRHNILITTSMRLQREQGKTRVVWYALKHR